MEYDRDIFAKFKALAVTREEDFVVGKTYYGNDYPENFIFYGTVEVPLGSSTKKFFRANPDSDETHSSLNDRNVNGGDYNPWLIFADEETRDLYIQELVITYPKGDYLDDYDDDEEEDTDDYDDEEED